MWVSLQILLPYLCFCSIAVIIIPLVPNWKSALGENTEIKSFTYPAVAGGLLAISVIYYALCFWSPRHSIIRLAGVEVSIKSMCNRRHQRFGYKYRVFITPNNNPHIGYMAQLLRWCFGWNLDSPTARVDPDRASQVWLEQHGPGVQGCTCT